jgi:hypothetical protein
MMPSWLVEGPMLTTVLGGLLAVGSLAAALRILVGIPLSLYSRAVLAGLRLRLRNLARKSADVATGVAP